MFTHMTRIIMLFQKHHFMIAKVSTYLCQHSIGVYTGNLMIISYDSFWIYNKNGVSLNVSVQ